jgi:hypothetical protein
VQARPSRPCRPTGTNRERELSGASSRTARPAVSANTVCGIGESEGGRKVPCVDGDVRPDRRPFAVSGIDHVQDIPGEAEAAAPSRDADGRLPVRRRLRHTRQQVRAGQRQLLRAAAVGEHVSGCPFHARSDARYPARSLPGGTPGVGCGGNDRGSGNHECSTNQLAQTFRQR